tara:strand:+ start:601 stop:786 length:186 start_codon:yes stop_codon:yes gene_type:complete
MNAKKLLDYLVELKKENDLSKIKINFRYSDESDVYEITKVEEDLKDSKTNNILESIIFKVK